MTEGIAVLIMVSALGGFAMLYYLCESSKRSMAATFKQLNRVKRCNLAPFFDCKLLICISKIV